MAVCNQPRIAALMCLTLSELAGSLCGDEPLPDARPVPALQVVPLPAEQASFQVQGRELTRYWLSPGQMRPFWYPIVGPQGRSLTRMGHPHDPIGHSHHNSVWIAHKDVSGVSFWEDKAPGRIVHQRTEEFSDGPDAASMLSLNAWVSGPDGNVLLYERRRATVELLEGPQWRMVIDLQFEALPGHLVTLGQTPFGLIGVRLAKPIGVRDGGGRILNSQGQLNETRAFRQPARWVDYSGPITENETAGIALLDHPANTGHPAPFHVREDGWMGACLTLNGPLTIEPGRPLRLRYGLWVHRGVPAAEMIDAQWNSFAGSPAGDLKPSRQ